MAKEKLPIYPLENGGYRIRPSIYNPFTERMEQKDFQNKNWTYELAKKELEKRIKKSSIYFTPKANTVLNPSSQISNAQIYNIQRKKDTLNDLYERWTIFRQKKYKCSYNEAITNIYKKYIKNELGAFKLEDLTQFDITQWTNNLSTLTVTNGNAKRLGEPLKDRTINQVITILSNLIEYGKKHESLSLSVIAYRIDENDTEEKQVIWTDEEIAKFLRLVKSDGNENDFLFFSILALTGIRKGEARALLCSTVDFKKKQILIDKNLCRHEKDDSDKSYVIAKTKGKDSTYLPLCDFELGILENIISQLEKEYDYNPNTYFIFGGKEPLSNNYFQDHFDKYKEKLSIIHPEIDTKLKIHGFRHSVATTIANQEDALAAKMQLRHKDISTTSNYIQSEINPEITQKRSNILHIE